MKTKKSRVLFVLICIFLLTVFSASVVRSETVTSIEPVAPEVNTEGLCYPVCAVVEEPPEPEYEMYFEESDVIALAKMLWGEARGCSVENQMNACWCVLNRVDSDEFPNTIIGVVSAPDQFHGYSPNYPVWDELYNIAEDVLIRWSLEKQGVHVNRELPESYLYFSKDGTENAFREIY